MRYTVPLYVICCTCGFVYLWVVSVYRCDFNMVHLAPGRFEFRLSSRPAHRLMLVYFTGKGSYLICPPRLMSAVVVLSPGPAKAIFSSPCLAACLVFQ